MERELKLHSLIIIDIPYGGFIPFYNRYGPFKKKRVTVEEFFDLVENEIPVKFPDRYAVSLLGICEGLIELSKDKPGLIRKPIISQKMLHKKVYDTDYSEVVGLERFLVESDPMFKSNLGIINKNIRDIKLVRKIEQEKDPNKKVIKRKRMYEYLYDNLDTSLFYESDPYNSSPTLTFMI